MAVLHWKRLWTPDTPKPAHGAASEPAQEPIRAEIFGPERFEQHGRSLGLSHRARKARLGQATFYPRLQDNVQRLRRAQRRLTQLTHEGQAIGPAAEWLFDNFHLIEGQIAEIRAALPPRYYRSLPVLQDAPLVGLPRIYGVAWAFVAHTDSAFDAELLQRFLEAYQDERELTQGELWALPTTLRVVLLENLRRLAERLADPRLSPADNPAQRGADQAADLMSMRNAVTALRSVVAADWALLISNSSRVVRVLMACPVFAAEDDASRDATLHAIEKRAARGGCSETAVAQQLLQLMAGAHGAEALSGHWLRGAGAAALDQALGLPPRAGSAQALWPLRLRAPAYLGAIAGGTALLLWPWLLARPWDQADAAHTTLWLVCAALMLLPASEAVVALVNRLIGESVRPRVLPRLRLDDGLPEAARVMVVIPTLLGHAAGIAATLQRLEQHHLANPEALAQFALLSDWADADQAGHPDDHRLLALAERGLQALNERHPVALSAPPRFLLLHRARTYSATQRRWLGWERKRGKLEQLIAALAGPSSGAFLGLGALSRIAPHTRYLLTLDGDTVLPPGRLHALLAVALHPANQPVLAPDGRSVQRGFGILQPRVAAPLAGPQTPTLWQNLLSTPGGLDPYSAMSSDVYQDVFGEGSFTGKGLLHVATVHAVLGARLPEDRVLSHDLLEGALVRCAVVSDITLIEPEPAHADTAAARLHRWARGDWQLLPFLLRRRAWPLGLVNRWKLFDNLRRSLVAPASLALIVLALAGQGPGLALALALTLAAVSAGPLMGALAAWVPGRLNLLGSRWFLNAAGELARAVLGALWGLALLLRHSLLMLDAVGRTLWRVTVSRRQLLQWTTAEAAQDGLRPGLGATLWRHRAEPAAAGLLALGLWALPAGLSAAAASLLLLWAGAPLLIWFSNTPWRWLGQRALAADDRRLLEDLARDTWRWFERCVNADNHHLPPDNLQTSPYELLAPRTSPTNIGLYVLSTACARHFGWIGSLDLLDRLEATLGTLRQMETHRGHFFNWTHTGSLAPLAPRYVSTVDSGNLCVHLLATAQACLALAEAPLDASALRAALGLSRERLLPHHERLQTLLGRPLMHTAIGQLLLAALPEPDVGSDIEAWNALLRAGRAQLHGLASRHDPAVVMPEASSDDELLWLLGDHLSTLESNEADRAAARLGQAEATTQRLLALAAALEDLAWAPEFGFLYHPRRHLLHIGYRVDDASLDASCYDLLASEARSTSLLAIAKGELPVRHWAALGRPFGASGPRAVLRSWSGSMFEYLMPGLVMAEPHSSALGEAARSALHEQIVFARSAELPWGISECAYAARDQALAYQYSPQGVPSLALRRTPPLERVIAPYATVLATQVDARAACDNLRRLETLGARARYGFVEALDFTEARQSEGGPFTLVHTFMAHHQGMGLVALCNVLHGGVAQRWGMAHARLQAVLPLLHESAPRALPHAPPGNSAPQAAPAPHSAAPVRHLVPGAQAVEPTQCLGNGRYHLTLRPNGAGWSRWGSAGITRWRDDALRDEHGSFVYLRFAPDAAPVSITSHPAPDPAARYHSRFHADRVCFEARWPGLTAVSTVWVSPEDDVELRRVALHNSGDTALELELIAALDITLCPHAADEAHPAFSNLFVKADWLAQQQALRFERRPRLQTEAPLLASLFVAGITGSAELLALRGQTDRLHWLGRNRCRAQPLAHLNTLPDTDSVQPTGLDPVAVLGLRLRLPPGAHASVVFATAASDDASTLAAVIDKYRQPAYVERASALSATVSSLPAAAPRPAAHEQAALQLICTALLMHMTRPDPHRDTAAPPHSDRRLLWPLGLSGDRPLLLVDVASVQGLALLRTLALGLSDWARCGMNVDLVLLSHEPHSYHMPLQQALERLRQGHAELGPERGASTGLHLLRHDALSDEQRHTLRAVARLALQANGRSLGEQVMDWSATFERSPPLGWLASAALPVPLLTHSAGAARPSHGHFLAERSDFVFEVDEHQRPPRPWVNVLANPHLGCIASESGGGNSWAGNSRLHQLSAWSNDPVADPPGEWLLIEDRRSREVWSLAPSAWGAPDARYQVRHRQGLTQIHHRHGGLEITLDICVDPLLAVKQLRIRLHNHGSRNAHLRLTGLVEWVMGEKRADRASLHSEAAMGSAGLLGLLCTQTEAAAGFGGSTAFFCEAREPGEGVDEHEGLDWTCDRRAFFDRQGRLCLPQSLGQRAGSGLDPCAALSRLLTLRPDSGLEQVYLIGHAATPEAALALMSAQRAVPPAAREQAVQAHWDALLGACEVVTPDPLFDHLVNRWLLYQTLSARLWAKAGFYQAGGATGFRDQLQDAMALAWAKPALLNEQILLCASRQFVQGDVQHWWHAPGGAGVRTHFSDDLLWLPYAIAHQLRSSGSHALLDQRAPFLESDAIPEGAEDRYDTPATSATDGSVFEHGARAIDRSLAVGAHGLPLMGGGDWNDGMNRVGIEGRGESVWLAWFLCDIVIDWIELARQRGETARVTAWETALAGWRLALGSEAWDGAWFKRAFFDDGSPLGSPNNAEARIDLIAQAWSVLSNQTSPERQRQAMTAVQEHLVDDCHGLIRLLDPPLVHAMPSAGYIQAYPAGVRENGGQYSHAGVWALMAMARLAQGTPDNSPERDLPLRWFSYLSPAHRASNPDWGGAYGLEPYAMAADVYSQPPYVGRGGWSWYTGAAGWLHRAALESILGLHIEGETLWFEPCLPGHWPRAEITLRREGRAMRFVLLRAAPPEALERAGLAADARLLRPGEVLNWRGLAPDSAFVVPLPALATRAG